MFHVFAQLYLVINDDQTEYKTKCKFHIDVILFLILQVQL
jgi:hypothetical protein